MKKFLLLFAAFMIIFSSCKKDDDCVGGDLETVIVGTWDVNIAGNSGEVEFKANGDLVDPDDTLIGTGGQSGDIKTYIVNSNDLLTLRAENAGSSVEYDIDITSYECDQIKFSFLGFTGTFDRK